MVDANQWRDNIIGAVETMLAEFGNPARRSESFIDMVRVARQILSQISEDDNRMRRHAVLTLCDAICTLDDRRMTREQLNVLMD